MAAAAQADAGQGGPPAQQEGAVTGVGMYPGRAQAPAPEIQTRQLATPRAAIPLRTPAGAQGLCVRELVRWEECQVRNCPESQDFATEMPRLTAPCA